MLGIQVREFTVGTEWKMEFECLDFACFRPFQNLVRRTTSGRQQKFTSGIPADFINRVNDSYRLRLIDRNRPTPAIHRRPTNGRFMRIADLSTSRQYLTFMLLATTCRLAAGCPLSENRADGSGDLVRPENLPPVEPPSQENVRPGLPRGKVTLRFWRSTDRCS